MIKFRHETTMAYWAGALTAKLHNNFYKQKDIPSAVVCMRDFQHLKVLFGKYYEKMKQNKLCYEYVYYYEKFNKINLPNKFLGEYSDFMLGYAQYRIKKKLTGNDIIEFEKLFN